MIFACLKWKNMYKYMPNVNMQLACLKKKNRNHNNDVSTGNIHNCKWFTISLMNSNYNSG